jgi:hypothetical protein
VACLFRAFPEQKQNTHNKFYLLGLGTPFNEDLVDKIYTIMDGAQSFVLAALKEQPKEMAKDDGIELFKGNNWWELREQLPDIVQGKQSLSGLVIKICSGNVK